MPYPSRSTSPRSWDRLSPDDERRISHRSYAGDPKPNPVRPSQLNAAERRLLGLIYLTVEPTGTAGYEAAEAHLRTEHPRADPRAVERVLEVYRRGEGI